MAQSHARYPIDTQNQLSQLFFAIEERCEGKIDQILKSGFDVNHVIRSSKSPSKTGRTALHHACGCRNNSAVGILLKFGADFTVKDEDGHTALHLCINGYRSDSTPIINSILDAHVDKKVCTNPVNNSNLSHFQIAHAMKHERAIGFFKEHCALDDAVLKNSPYPAIRALVSNELRLMELVLHEKGKTYELKSEMKCTHDDPSKTIKKEREKIKNKCAKWFPENTELNPTDEFMKTCLKATEEDVKKSLELNPVDLSQEGIGKKALYLASHAESINNVKVLLEHGANFFVTFDGQKIPDICTKMFGWRVLELLQLIDPLDESCALENEARKFCLSVMNPANSRVQYRLLNVNYNLKSKLDEFINSPCTSSDSQIWRGATILHLIATFTCDSDESHDSTASKPDENQNDSVTIVRQLLSIGADSSIQDSNGRTPLHQALHHGNLKIARELLKKNQEKPQINPTDDTGLSHLHVACLLGDDSAIAFLRCDEVNVNTKISREIKVKIGDSTIKFSSGSTPLHAAVLNHERKTVEWLMRKGADVFAEDIDGLTPIHYFTMYYKDEDTHIAWQQISGELFSHKDIKSANPASNKVGLSHLQAACGTHKLELIEALLELGADVNAPPACLISKNKNLNKNVLTRNTLVQIAYKLNDLEMLEVFAKRGADFNAPNSDGLSCLHMALANWLEGCPRQDVKKVVDLMKFDWKNPGPIDRTGLTQLHVACALGIINSVKKLVQAGANVNKPISTKSPFMPGLTPLLATVMFCKFRSKDQYIIIMKILLRNGANPSCKTLENETAIHLAYKLNKPELANLILNHGKIVRSNPKNDFGLSHFHIACAIGSEEVVTRFLKYGVDVNEPVSIFSKGWNKTAYEQVSGYSAKTPLHFAINAENDSSKSILTTLLSRGANPNMQDRKGWTPLNHACEKDNVDHVRILLRSEEIDVNSVDACGDTALHSALNKLKVNKEIIRLLLARGASMDTKSFESAAKKGDVKILNLIVNSCKGISFKDKNGANAVHKLVEHSGPRLILDWPERSHRKRTSSNYANLTKERGRRRDSRSDLRECKGLDEDKLSNLIWSLSKKGVDVNGQDSTGNTPLHLAVKNNRAEAVEALLNNGVDFEITNRNGVTAIQLAISMRAASLFRIFERHLKTFERVGKNTKLVKYLAEADDSLKLYSRLGISTGDEADPIERVLMETTQLSDDFSLHDMLTTSERRTEKFVGNSRLLEVLDSSTFYKDYPTLGGVLKHQYRIGCKRKDLKESAGIGLSQVIKINLVEPCVEALATYLSHKDLENLAKLCE